MRQMIMCSLHYGHPGRDATLSMVADIWWHRIHRDVIDQDRLCEHCLQAGKNLKCVISQTAKGKIPVAKEQNEEVALDFAGPFQNAKKGKKYLLVSIDHFSGRPDAKFLQKPKSKKVSEFLKQYIGQYGAPKKMRADPGTVFMSEAFRKFCNQFCIEHITCPKRDHKGNGKIERLIRTINERLRANKQIILTKDQSGLSEILYALRISKRKDGKSPFEKQLGREANTVKSNAVSKFLDILEQNNSLEFSPTDIQDDLDSTVLVTERSRGSKLEVAFERKTGGILKESEHTITILPEASNKEKMYSKQDIAKLSKEQKKIIGTQKRKRVVLDTSSNDEEPTKEANTRKKTNQKPQEIAFDLENEQRPEIIDIATSSTNRGDETTKGPAVKTENDKEQKIEEAPGSSTIPINATIRWELEKAGPVRVLDRKRVPTMRYGIHMTSKATTE